LATNSGPAEATLEYLLVNESHASEKLVVIELPELESQALKEVCK
tara:strand:+ start:405 stop:539 length:135 start_codon:yes stop_codon:yes gene_type:complete